jgi:hypothetical protein
MASTMSGRALVARNHFELGAGALAVHIDVVAGRGAGGARAHDGLLALRVFEGFDLGFFRRYTDSRGTIGAAEILEFGWVEQRLRPIFEEWGNDHARKHRADHRSVLRRERINKGCRSPAAGTGQVLGNDRRAAWDESRKVPADCTGIDVVAAADCAADDKLDGLAGVEIFGRRRSCAENGSKRRGSQRQSDARSAASIRHVAKPFVCLWSCEADRAFAGILH